MFLSFSSIPKLTEDKVYLYIIDVNDFNNHQLEFFRLLSKDEQKRAQQFRFEKDRKVYITAKAILRKLIGVYISQEAKNIVFSYNKQLKPSIESDINLKFNVSHSKDKILIGFTVLNEIGVDIEFNKRSIEIAKIAKRFFTHNEYTVLMDLPTHLQLPCFYNCWTRKEAFIKAKGGGLSIPLDQFEVTLSPNISPELKVIQWDQQDVANWKLSNVETGEDYTSAVIVHHHFNQLKQTNVTLDLLHHLTEAT